MKYKMHFHFSVNNTYDYYENLLNSVNGYVNFYEYSVDKTSTFTLQRSLAWWNEPIHQQQLIIFIGH